MTSAHLNKVFGRSISPVVSDFWCFDSPSYISKDGMLFNVEILTECKFCGCKRTFHVRTSGPEDALDVIRYMDWHRFVHCRGEVY